MPYIVAVVLASLAMAGVGYTSGEANTDTTQSAVALLSIEDALGTWEGTIDPPDEAPPGLEFNFEMELEDDGAGIVGTFTIHIAFQGEEQSVEMEIIDGEYDDESGEFTCEIVPPEDAGGGENGVMTATIDGDSIEGTISGDDDETSFSGSRG
jgi:hypothetical protein